MQEIAELPEELDDVLNEVFMEYDIPIKWLGRKYIKDICGILYDDENLIRSLNSKVYPMVAMKNGTKVANVEKAIRNSLTKTSHAHDKTTNKTFLTKLLEKLKRGNWLKIKKMIKSLLLMRRFFYDSRRN